MATLDSRFTINGLVDTSRPSFENLETITNACATWLSYDGLTGDWSVVINQAGNVAYSFDDSNIIGGISLTSTSLDGMYNECEVRFHNQTLRDQEDYVLLAVPAGDLLPNEQPNRLIINAPLVNNQIQAQLLGLIELKQSRLDWVISFDTDFSHVSIDAGDIIEVTNASYGWTQEQFRVLKVNETEADGALTVNITAQQYDANIYSTADLFEYVRPTETGLIQLDPLRDVSPITDNTAVLDSSGNSLLGLLGANALVALIKKLMEDQDTGSGSLWKEIFDIFDTETGQDLRTVASAGNIMISADSGTLTTVIPQSGSNVTYQLLGNSTFTPTVSGTYVINAIFDQNNSGAIGGRGADWSENEDRVSVEMVLWDITGNTFVSSQASGGFGTFFWTDWSLTDEVTLTANTSYDLRFGAINWTESDPTANANITVGWNVFTATI